VEKPLEPATPIHPADRLGWEPLIELLLKLKVIGVNHMVFNFKYGHRPADEVLEEIGQEVLPHVGDRQKAILGVADLGHELNC